MKAIDETVWARGLRWVARVRGQLHPWRAVDERHAVDRALACTKAVRR